MAEEKPDHEIVLFVKAGSDRECIGCCPFSQRLFMILWLKGTIFNVTTVDSTSKPKELSDIAPGTSTPFLMYDGEVITDNLEIEEFLESHLLPPKYPSLAAQNPESLVAGNDIFSKFSAWIKCSLDHPNYKTLQQRFHNSLLKLNEFLKTRLDENTARLYVDSNRMTLPDCGMLPKLHIAIVAARERRGYDIISSFDAIGKYMNNAYACDEFAQTCCDDAEIAWCYGGPKPKLKPLV